MSSLPGGEFQTDMAGKKARKFYSLMAASGMLSDRAFFDYVVQMMGSISVPLEERCDLICVLGEVFAQFGSDMRSGEGAEVSEKSGIDFVSALLEIIGRPNEKQEVKAACAIALKKALSNPAISTELPPETAKSAFARLALFGNDLSPA